MSQEPVTLDADTVTRLAASLFNGVWTLLENPNRTPDDDLLMIHMVHASCYHWGRVGTAVNFVRGEWQCSRVYATLGRSEPALFHAQRALAICEGNGIGGFDLAFCYEALARAHAVAGDLDEARRWHQSGLELVNEVDDDEDREILAADLASVPI
jgi:tetratricopeptide (TPR) repeat protein